MSYSSNNHAIKITALKSNLKMRGKGERLKFNSILTLRT